MNYIAIIMNIYLIFIQISMNNLNYQFKKKNTHPSATSLNINAVLLSNR